MTSGCRRLSVSSASASSRSIRSRVVLRARCSSTPSSSVGTSHGSWSEPARRPLGENGDRLPAFRAAGEPVEDVEQRRVRLAGLFCVTLPARNENPALGKAVEERLHERRLPDSGLTGDEDDLPPARQCLFEHPGETAELDLTTEEARGVRPGLTGRRSVDCGGPTRTGVALAARARHRAAGSPAGDPGAPSRGSSPSSSSSTGGRPGSLEYLGLARGRGPARGSAGRAAAHAAGLRAQRAPRARRRAPRGGRARDRPRSGRPARQPQLLEAGDLGLGERLVGKSASAEPRQRASAHGPASPRHAPDLQPRAPPAPGRQALEAARVDSRRARARGRSRAGAGGAGPPANALRSLGDGDLDRRHGGFRGVSPQRSSTSRTTATARIASRSSTASSARCLVAPGGDDLTTSVDHLQRPEDPELHRVPDSSTEPALPAVNPRLAVLRFALTAPDDGRRRDGARARQPQQAGDLLRVAAGGTARRRRPVRCGSRGVLGRPS